MAMYHSWSIRTARPSPSHTSSSANRPGARCWESTRCADPPCPADECQTGSCHMDIRDRPRNRPARTSSRTRRCHSTSCSGRYSSMIRRYATQCMSVPVQSRWWNISYLLIFRAGPHQDILQDMAQRHHWHKHRVPKILRAIGLACCVAGLVAGLFDVRDVSRQRRLAGGRAGAVKNRRVEVLQPPSVFLGHGQGEQKVVAVDVGAVGGFAFWRRGAGQAGRGVVPVLGGGIQAETPHGHNANRQKE